MESWIGLDPKYVFMGEILIGLGKISTILNVYLICSAVYVATNRTTRPTCIKIHRLFIAWKNFLQLPCNIDPTSL